MKSIYVSRPSKDVMNEAAQKESEAATLAKTAAELMDQAEEAMAATKGAHFAAEKAAKKRKK